VSNSEALASAIATVLVDHKAMDVIILDLREVAGWTDYFVVGTGTSSTHLRGLSRFVDEHLSLNKVDRLNFPVCREDDRWILHDLGDVVVHLMDAEARKFYELEKLWFKAPVREIKEPARELVESPPEAGSE